MIVGKGETKMQTFYADIYFLINFTVDLLSLHLASRFLHIPCKVPKMLLLCAAEGALSVCSVIFFNEMPLLRWVFSLLFFLFVFLLPSGCGFSRRLLYAIGFLLFETVFGGVVTALSRLLDPAGKLFSGEQSYENRQLLWFSCIVLLTDLGAELLYRFLSSRPASERLETEICFCGKRTRFACLVDSGNLLTDPLSGLPVLLVKEKQARDLFGDACVPGGELPVSCDRFRAIPLHAGGSVRILTGFSPDSTDVYFSEKKHERIRVIVAIDKEEGDFGGCQGLLPFAAIRYVHHPHHP